MKRFCMKPESIKWIQGFATFRNPRQKHPLNAPLGPLVNMIIGLLETSREGGLLSSWMLSQTRPSGTPDAGDHMNKKPEAFYFSNSI